MTEPTLSHSIKVQVPFHDADPAGVVWHGHYLKYFELVRCELLELFDYNYIEMAESGYVWPVVDVAVRYAAPAMFNDRLTVTASLLEYEFRLRIGYRVFGPDGELCCEAQTDQVPINLETREMEIGVPDTVIKRIRSAIQKAGANRS